jgi:uncharacterized oxidoreductase
MELTNKKTLITGGGSGIGLAIAHELIENGAEVIICGRNKSKLDVAKSKVSNLRIEVCDVTDDSQISQLVNTLEANGGIDILINNAGVLENIDYSADSQSMETQEREINIDFLGPIRMTHHFLPMLKSKLESAIVNVSSGLAFVPLASAPVYSATKAGLHSWTQSLRYQLANTHVRVFELMPPLVDTEMVSQFTGQSMMAPDKLAKTLVKGLKSNKYEITPAQSNLVRMMSRLAPRFSFKMLNRQMS